MEENPRSITDSNGNGEIKEKRQKKQKKSRQNPYRWAIRVFFFTLAISIIFGILSGETDNFHLWSAFLVLFFFVAVGVVFDMVGVAVVSADEKPFHAMAAKKIRSAKKAIWLIRKADAVSSFCNDVIGDIAGVMSGACAAAISLKLFAEASDIYKFWGSILITAFLSAVIVGAKAFCKPFALAKSQDIVFFAAKCLNIFSKKSK